MGKQERLDRIAAIIEQVDNRCLMADGPVTPTLQEMTQGEISEIYALAKEGAESDAEIARQALTALKEYREKGGYSLAEIKAELEIE